MVSRASGVRDFTRGYEGMVLENLLNQKPLLMALTVRFPFFETLDLFTAKSAFPGVISANFMLSGTGERETRFRPELTAR